MCLKNRINDNPVGLSAGRGIMRVCWWPDLIEIKTYFDDKFYSADRARATTGTFIGMSGRGFRFLWWLLRSVKLVRPFPLQCDVTDWNGHHLKMRLTAGRLMDRGSSLIDTFLLTKCGIVNHVPRANLQKYLREEVQLIILAINPPILGAYIVTLVGYWSPR